MSIINQLVESTSAVLDNYEVNYTLNEFAGLYNSFPVMEESIRYCAEAVPVFRMYVNEQLTFCVEQDNLIKLMASQNINEAEALNQIFDCLQNDGEPVDDMKDIAVVVPKEDIEGIAAEVKSDPSKIDAKCEAVESCSDRYHNILEAGAQIVIGESLKDQVNKLKDKFAKNKKVKKDKKKK